MKPSPADYGVSAAIFVGIAIALACGSVPVAAILFFAWLVVFGFRR